ncbi:FAD:protein FMN transferase [Anaerosporobacter faecicola]|uniref:FAD:protein FMN transferase n=1 Tax=Anaerosporobacter faecicola TaxID=2718714 RepID=UPI00143A6BC2|nr:FAD:protein FMN transferase [Anaerosporobacter faecicola]
MKGQCIKRLSLQKLLIPLFIIVIVIFSIFFYLNHRYDNARIEKSALKLNTYIKVTLYGTKDESLIDDVFALCDYYENLLSKTIETSDISRFNHRTDDEITVSNETATLIKLGLSYADQTNGAFNIAIGKLTDLWNFTADEPKVPEDSLIKGTLSHIDQHALTIDGNTLHSTDTQLEVDLGAIAKGFIADQMKQFLLERGVTSGTINLGGNVLCIGSKPDHSPFQIGIQKPFSEQGEVLLAVEATDSSVVTSGTYERYFIENEKLYHHILDSKTGYPFDNGLASVTILSKKSVDGDALSTSCFALGLEEGMKLIDSMEDTYAIFVTEEEEIYYSQGLQDAYTIILP